MYKDEVYSILNWEVAGTVDTRTQGGCTQEALPWPHLRGRAVVPEAEAELLALPQRRLTEARINPVSGRR